MNMLNKILLSVAVVGFCVGLQAATVVESVALPAEAAVVKSPVPPLVTFGMGTNRPIVATTLNLYGLIQLVAANIDNQSKQLMLESTPNMDRQTVLGAAFQLATESMKLFVAIVDGFNKGGFYYNPELKYRFITVCNAIDIKSSIEPCDLRRLNLQLKTFCRQVKAYSNSHKGFLSKDDGELSDKIINFGNALTSGLLREEFFDIDWADKVVDWTIYRPAEFVADNKELIITLGIVSIAAVGMWYLKKNDFDSTPPQHPASAVVGLQNADGLFIPTTANNCWLNASAQCLFRADAINERLQGKQLRLGALFESPDRDDRRGAAAMRAWGNLITSLHAPVTAPAQFHHAVRNAYFDDQRRDTQQDASEFINHFFGDLRERLGVDPFSVPLHQVRMHGQCPQCHVPALRRDVMVNHVGTLGLQIPPMVDKNPTLQDCLRGYFAPVANTYAHPTCGHRFVATEQQELGAYPEMLVVSLNRFVNQPVMDEHGQPMMRLVTDARTGAQHHVPAMDMAKIQTPVAIPQVLDLATCCGDQHPGGDGQYDILGVVLHGGSRVDTGHYVAVTRAQDGSWHYFSDQHTYPVNNMQERLAAGVYHDEHYNWLARDGHVYDPVPYVVFYRKRQPVVVTPPVVKQPVATTGAAASMVRQPTVQQKAPAATTTSTVRASVLTATQPPIVKAPVATVLSGTTTTVMPLS